RTDTVLMVLLSGQAGGAEGFQGRGDVRGRGDDGRDGVQGLQAVPRVDDHGFGGRVEGTGPDELAQGRDGDAAGGLAEDALGAGEQPDALDHLLVGDVLDGAVRAADDVQDVRAVGGVAD